MVEGIQEKSKKRKETVSSELPVSHLVEYRMYACEGKVGHCDGE